MKPIITTTFLILFFSNLFAQVKIGGAAEIPHASAVLELDGGNNRGLLLPSMRKMDIDAIQNPADGLTIYATDEQAVYVRKSLVWEKQAPFNLPYSAILTSNKGLLKIKNEGIFGASNAIEGFANDGIGLEGGTLRGQGVSGYAYDVLGIAGFFVNNFGGTALSTIGKTGIGTVNPVSLLHVDASNTNSEAMIVNDNALVTVQLQNEGEKKGYLQADVNNMVMATNLSNNTGKVVLRTNNIDRFVVNPDGRIIINSSTGTSPPGTQFLKVKGGIQATDFTVTTLANWPDYVFDPSYKLRSLEETEAFIKEHKHLPNIPAAAVVDKEGFALGEMQKKMMEKIEELTLYLIEANKNIQHQQKEIDELKKKVDKPVKKL